MGEINYRGLNIPRESLGGEMTTDHLFGPNEQVIFDFYEVNQDRYKKAVDIGANIGVHSILMARQGWKVTAIEPDLIHFRHLQKNIMSHGVEEQVRPVWAAASDRLGRAGFVRVLNNLTASHLVGAKDSYGPTEETIVDTIPSAPLFEWADFVKMDCEGHEAVIIESLPPEIWNNTDCLLEVGSLRSASVIYEKLVHIVPMWAQRQSWKQVDHLSQMPQRHQHGSLFIGRKPPFGGK